MYEHALRLVQFGDKQLVPTDDTHFVVSGHDWLHIVAVSRASEREAADLVAEHENSINTVVFAEPWWCREKKQIYTRPTLRIDLYNIGLQPDQTRCLLCPRDVTQLETPDPATPMTDEGCRPALDFARLAKLKPDGTLDWDCESRSAPMMNISRVPEEELPVIPVASGVDESAAVKGMLPAEYTKRLDEEQDRYGLSDKDVIMRHFLPWA